MNPQVDVGSLLLVGLEPLIFGWLGAIAGFMTISGIGLVSLYFLNFTFRKVLNTTFPPKGRQAIYGRNGSIYRDGWAYDAEDSRWHYVKRPYTKYRKASK